MATEREPAVDATDLLAPDGRPQCVELLRVLLCCGQKTVTQIAGTYRCPCGYRHEKAAREAICSRLLRD